MEKVKSKIIRCIYCDRYNHELKNCLLYKEIERQLMNKYPQADITIISQLSWNSRTSLINVNRGWKYRRRQTHINNVYIARRVTDSSQSNTVQCNNNVITATKEKREVMSASKKKRLRRIRKWKRRFESVLKVKSSSATVVLGGKESIPTPAVQLLSKPKDSVKLGEQSVKAKLAASLEKTKVLGGEVPKTSTAAVSTLEKNQEPGSVVSKTSAAAHLEKTTLLATNSQPSQQQQGNSPVTGAPNHGSGPSKQERPEEKDIRYTLSTQEWYEKCVTECLGFKEMYPNQLSKEKMIEMTLDRIKRYREVPVYSRIKFEGGELYLNIFLYSCQICLYFVANYANLDEDVHLWVLPDPNEDCYYRASDQEKYEFVKIDMVKQYIRFSSANLK